MSTRPSINLAKFETTATRDLADRKPGLLRHIAVVEKQARVEALAMPREQLRREVAELTGKEWSRAAFARDYDRFVDEYTVLKGKATEAYKLLTELRAAADADREAARKINDMIEGYDKSDVKARAYLEESPDLSGAVLDIAEILPAKLWMGQYGAEVARRVNDGHEFRDSVRRALEVAVGILASFPREIRLNGLRPSHRSMNEFAKAEAAGEFVKSLSRAYGDDPTMTIPMELIGLG